MTIGNEDKIYTRERKFIKVILEAQQKLGDEDCAWLYLLFKNYGMY
jgi:hypothetical protein